MGKDKGKAAASSSAPKRRHLVNYRESSDEDMEEEATHTTHSARDPEPESYLEPRWGSGPLSQQHLPWQPILFKAKLSKLKDKKEGFLCEREVPEEQFGPFGVYDKFRALGWEAALKCHDQVGDFLYIEEIEEWVSTLRMQTGNRPSDMRLIGHANGVQVTMDFQSLRGIARFDSKTPKTYTYPDIKRLFGSANKLHNWNEMVNDLFISPRSDANKLLRRDLKIQAKLLLIIIQLNVMPRRGDKVEVRHPEVPILHALMHGEPLISIRYLIMHNIWQCREQKLRQFIPHCRLITALLKRAGALDVVGVTPVSRRHVPFCVRDLGAEVWVYSESERYHKLKSEGQKWRVLKVDARALVPGEVDEPDSDEERSGDEGYHSEPDRAAPAYHGGASGSGAPPHSDPYAGYGSRFDYASFAGTHYAEDWAHQGSMEQVIMNHRPDEYYQWPHLTQVSYDHVTHMGASIERQLKGAADRQETWNRVHEYSFQEEINHDYEDAQRQRMHNEWHAQQPVVVDPMLIDYTSLPPNDGSTSYPNPPVHHSQWVDPREEQQQPPPQDQGSFGFGEFQDVMQSIFGPPRPRYY